MCMSYGARARANERRRKMMMGKDFVECQACERAHIHEISASVFAIFAKQERQLRQGGGVTQYEHDLKALMIQESL